MTAAFVSTGFGPFLLAWVAMAVVLLSRPDCAVMKILHQLFGGHG